jgi:hypothetical protein
MSSGIVVVHGRKWPRGAWDQHQADLAARRKAVAAVQSGDSAAFRSCLPTVDQT